MSKIKCPSEITLRLFNDGQLDVDDIDVIALHVDRCGLCLARLEALVAGPLELGIREAASEERRPEGDDESKIDSEAQKVLDSVYPDIADTVVSHRGCDLYRLTRKVGTAAIGQFYEATDLVMERKVLVLIPNTELVSSVDHRAQLTLDGNNASWLKHENILRVIQFGNWDNNRCYLAMPEITALTLARILECGVQFNLGGLLTVIGQICSAVQYAHRLNVLHRHLQPTNIYVSEDLHVLVSEFGLVFDGRYHFELIEPLVHPTPYNSPESSRNEAKRIDVRTDIFSIGAILDSLLDAAPNLGEQNLHVLRDVARKCQRSSRKKRYQRIEQLIEDIGKRVDPNAS